MGGLPVPRTLAGPSASPGCCLSQCPSPHRPGSCLHPHDCFSQGVAQPKLLLKSTCLFYFRLSLHEQLADDYLRLLPDVMLRRSSFLPSHSVPPEACNQLICITRQMYPEQLAQGHCFPATKHVWFFCPNLKLSLLESDILWLLPNYQLGAEQLRFCRVKKVMPTSGLLNLSTTDILC